MSLDQEKLECVHESGGRTLARCPACAASGHDRRGVHLILYPDGRFGCAAYPGDSEHRRIIWRLAGGANEWKIHDRLVRASGARGSSPISRTDRTSSVDSCSSARARGVTHTATYPSESSAQAHPTPSSTSASSSSPQRSCAL